MRSSEWGWAGGITNTTSVKDTGVQVGSSFFVSHWYDMNMGREAGLLGGKQTGCFQEQQQLCVQNNNSSALGGKMMLLSAQYSDICDWAQEMLNQEKGRTINDILD